MTKTATVHAQQKWEYLAVTRRSETGLMEELETAGQQGWEMCSVVHGKDVKGEMSWTAFLKRPFVPQAGAPTQPAATKEDQQLEHEHRIEPVESSSGFDLNGETFEIREES